MKRYRLVCSLDYRDVLVQFLVINRTEIHELPEAV